MDFQQVDINSLIAYPENARTHDEKQIKQIAKSIKKFGFCAPCLVDDDGVLIAGHGRLMAAQTLGLETIPVVRINHLTPEQVKAYRIADNQLALNAHWDVGLLSLELGNLKDAGFDLDLLGFDPDIAGLPFKPDIDPLTGMHEIDQRHLDQASVQTVEQFEGLGSDKASAGIEVSCPHCSQSFTFSGA